MNRDVLNRRDGHKFTPGGSASTTFDGAGRIDQISILNKNDATVGSFDLAFDPNSNITGIDQFVSPTTTAKSYVYDAENRLTEAQHGSSTETWNLDLLGNWLGGGRVFNNANQLIEDTNYFYTYDPRGNLVQKSAKIGPEIINYTWDFFDRLVVVETPSKRVSFKYDATGRRIERTLEDLVSNTTKIRKWTYLKDDQWTESDELNQVLAVTLNGESIDDVLSLSLKGVSQTTPGIALEPVKDHLGSVYAWSNSNTGAIVQKQSYTAYGETTVSQSSQDLEQLANLRGYTSREYDHELGIYYYRARYYDPKNGKFTSKDPKGHNSSDMNFYNYVLNNPSSFTDPRGLDAHDGPLAIRWCYQNLSGCKKTILACLTLNGFEIDPAEQSNLIFACEREKNPSTGACQ